MQTPRYRFRVNEFNYDFLLLLFGGRIPKDRLRYENFRVYIYVSAKKVHRIADEVRLTEEGGLACFKEFGHYFKYELPKAYQIPKHENFSAHRTKSDRWGAGSRRRRPIHGWSKRKRKHYLGGV